MALDHDDLTATRRALHAVVEHVLLPDLHDRTGRIGLHLTPEGIAAPPYEATDGAPRRLLLAGTDVIDERDGVEAARVPLVPATTLGALRAALGVTAQAPGDVYDLGSSGDGDQVLAVDPAAAETLGEILSATGAALEDLRAEVEAEGSAGPDDVGAAVLWPERLSLACPIQGVDYGASPGDAEHPEPFLFATPWEAPEGSGAPGLTRPALPVPTAGEALAFFREARARLRG